MKERLTQRHENSGLNQSGGVAQVDDPLPGAIVRIAMHEEIQSRLGANLDRVRAIVDVYQDRAGVGPGRRPVATVDLLRAAVVFLHATLEDVLRSALAWKWPQTTAPEHLTDIPLVGHRKSKIELADLLPHRGEAIDDVIRRSVEAQLERSNFNNVGEVKSALDRAGLSPALVTPYQTRLAGMIVRRHNIVHHADRHDSVGPGHHGAGSLARPLVTNWVDAVDAFCTEIIAHL